MPGDGPGSFGPVMLCIAFAMVVNHRYEDSYEKKCFGDRGFSDGRCSNMLWHKHIVPLGRYFNHGWVHDALWQVVQVASCLRDSWRSAFIDRHCFACNWPDNERMMSKDIVVGSVDVHNFTPFLQRLLEGLGVSKGIR